MKNKHCKLYRDDVIGGGVVDKIINCSWDDINLVLRDWKKIMKNYKNISVDVSLTLFSKYPKYKTLFTSFADVPDGSLETDEDFLLHSYAILRGINSVMLNFSGEYEDENEILPFIGTTHNKRGITPTIMNDLKEVLLSTCCEYLNSNKASKKSWEAVLDFIFNDFLYKNYNIVEEEDTEKTEVKKVKKVVEAEKTQQDEEENYDLILCQASDLSENIRDVTLINLEVQGSGYVSVNNMQVKSTSSLYEQSRLAQSSSSIHIDRRPSRTFLHPDHAKIRIQQTSLPNVPSPQQQLFDDISSVTLNKNSPLSSSAASSVASITGAPGLGLESPGPVQNWESRRCSVATNQYSLLDALDLEYALIRAAARGSVDPYNLSQSLQKLTFTQSLAFPALARSLSNKRNSVQSNNRGPLGSLDSGFNAFAKVATVLVLVLISVLVFGVLYKFIRT